MWVFVQCIDVYLFLQKSHARRKALVASRSIDDDTKKKVMEVLKPEFMSSEDSATENEEENESGSDESDNETPRRKQGKKKLIRHTLSWRNRECQNAMESLDRKLQRKRTPRGKAMCLRVEMGGNSSRPKPDHFPEWATELFD